MVTLFYNAMSTAKDKKHWLINDKRYMNYKGYGSGNVLLPFAFEGLKKAMRNLSRIAGPWPS